MNKCLFKCILKSLYLIIYLLIRYEVKELSKFTNTKEKKVFASNFVIIDEIKWLLNVSLENFEDKKSNKCETFIGVSLIIFEKPIKW